MTCDDIVKNNHRFYLTDFVGFGSVVVLRADGQVMSVVYERHTQFHSP